MPNLMKLLDQLEAAIPQMRETLGGDEEYMDEGEGDIPALDDMGGAPEGDMDLDAMMADDMGDVPPMPEEDEEVLPKAKKKLKL